MQLNSNSNMKLTCEQTRREREQVAKVTGGKVKHEWADWSGEESWRTYSGLGAEHRIADVTQVAVGIERGALDLKVSILLRARARHQDLRFSLEF